MHTLPDGYLPRQQWPEYLPETEEPSRFSPISIGAMPKGKRWGFGPFVFEEYVSDEEPVLGTGPLRVVFWHRPSRTDTPKGWYRLSNNPSRREGVIELAERYWEHWDESARRYRNKWLRDYAPMHAIEPISFDEYARAYRMSHVYEKAGELHLDGLAKLLASPSATHVELMGVRGKEHGEIEAGLAVLRSPSLAAAYYQSGFLTRAAEGAPHMLGLFDYWCARELARGTKLLYLGGFWHQGKQKKAWGGFSVFKSKFDPRLIDHAPELIRIAW